VVVYEFNSFTHLVTNIRSVEADFKNLTATLLSNEGPDTPATAIMIITIDWLVNDCVLYSQPPANSRLLLSSSALLSITREIRGWVLTHVTSLQEELYPLAHPMQKE
jgi:hypothetical protein